MRISVAMCTYNGETHLREQLESIAVQTRLPDELVVCDDASADATANMLRDFARAAPFPVRLHVNERTLGVVPNFEQAIRFCAGDVIALCDQDDVWRACKLARINQIMRERPDVGMIFTDADVIDRDSRPSGWRLWRGARFTPAERREVEAGRGFYLFARRNVVTGATLAFRDRHRDLVLPIETRARYLIHDAWIALLIATVAPVVASPEPLISYRLHAGQQMGVHAPDDSTTADDPRGYYQHEIEKLETILAALDRLAGRITAGDSRRAAELTNKRRFVSELVAHYRVRGGLSDDRARRLLPLAREIASGRYHRFSRGFSSAAKDALRSQPK